MSGCASLAALPGPSAADPVAATPAAPPADPFTAFVAAAAPGSETMLVPPGGGQPERVRLQRAYAAASGRECREVLIGAGLAERSALLCQEGAGWEPARPLLKGGGARWP